jgi:hypothetical protein
MSYRAFFIAVAVILALAGVIVQTAATQAATTITDNESVPISFYGYVPCANGGAGEYVQLSGNLHIVSHTTIDSRGGAHIMLQFNPQGVSGVGLTTGDKYRATGVTHYNVNARSLPFNTTYVNNFRLIGQGPGNNFTVHENFHITINAKGELTAVVTNFRFECKRNDRSPTPTTGPYPGPTTGPYPGPTPTTGPYPGPTPPTSPYPQP